MIDQRLKKTTSLHALVVGFTLFGLTACGGSSGSDNATPVSPPPPPSPSTPSDSDGDGTPDDQDRDPNDPNIGGPNSDADGDGVLDNDDPAPRNPDVPGDEPVSPPPSPPPPPTPAPDLDGDGTPDDQDGDIDGDGVLNADDQDPRDPNVGASPPPPPPPPPPSTGPFNPTNIYADSRDASFDQIGIETLHVFGDSHSVETRGGVQNWSKLFAVDGAADDLNDWAAGGATSTDQTRPTSGRPLSFGLQVDDAIANGLNINNNDLTVAFFGANDVARNLDMGQAANDFRAQADRLIDKGAATGDRRMFVFTLFDISEAPSYQGQDDVAEDVRAWNDSVRGYANGKNNVIAVDLFTVFERIFANPGQFGFANVNDASANRAGNDYLWADGEHFGARGQEIVKQVAGHYLTRGWDWANRASAGSAAQAELNADIDAGRLGINGLAERPLALVAFPLGDAAPIESLAFGAGGRASFDEVNRGRADGGAGVEYRLNEGTALGFASGRYTQGSDTARGLTENATDLVADAVAVYLRQQALGFDLETRVSVAENDVVERRYDALLDQRSSAQASGSSRAVSQRASVALRGDGYWLRPWASLGWQESGLDAHTFESPYLGSVRYDAGSSSQVEGGIGFNLTGDPLALGRVFSEEAFLTLSSDVGMSRTFGREDLSVTVRDSVGSQTETIERAELATVSLGLQGELALGPRMGLGVSGRVLDNSEVGRDAEMGVSAFWRF